MPRLGDFPAGGTLFLDANIFLEHLLRSESIFTALFQRLSTGEIRGVTSVAVLAEVRHRLLLTEAIRRGYVAAPHRALEVLRARPEILRHLVACDAGLNLLLETPLRVVSVTPAQFRLATMRAHRLRHLASADRDFRRVPRVTLWSP